MFVGKSTTRLFPKSSKISSQKAHFSEPPQFMDGKRVVVGIVSLIILLGLYPIGKPLFLKSQNKKVEPPKSEQK